jgi:Tfp pilus assembly protein PilF
MKTSLANQPRFCLVMPMLAFVVACLACVDLFADGPPPKLLTPEQLVGCECHVIGIYSPENGDEDDRVYVKITSTGAPMVIVLTGYFDAQWNVEIAPGAEVKQIIVSGWFEQSMVGVPDDIPVTFIIGNAQAKSPDKNYFWGYAPETKEGRDVLSKAQQLTGLPVTTFQGKYQGKRFVIDGILGKRDQKSTSDPTPLPLPQDRVHDREVVEAHVRKLFELDMKNRQVRIAKAEEDLNRIKTKFAKRQATSEQLIASQIEAIMASNEEMPKAADTSPKAVANANPTAEGWRLWQQSKWKEALPMFLAGVEKDPNDAAAWNGLGWTRFHLAEWDDAIAAFSRALELEPTNGGARNGRGRVLMSKGRFDDAEADLLKATKDTIEEYGEAQAVQLAVTASWFGLVEVNIAQKDYATAKDWAERYLKHKPDDPSMRRLLKQVSK